MIIINTQKSPTRTFGFKSNYLIAGLLLSSIYKISVSRHDMNILRQT